MISQDNFNSPRRR